MPAIIEERIIEVATQRVWEALTLPEEIEKWWADEARVQPEVGSLGEFRFRAPALYTFQFEVAELDQDKLIRWTSRQGPPQWAGTSVIWQLAPIQDGTEVVFTHGGFAQDEGLEVTRGNWAYFLDSLKSYLETGQGTPGTPLSVQEGRLP